jgi:signal transduction histidine kinase/ligand-binding sensor domain-containing protein
MEKARKREVFSLGILLACCVCAFGLDPSLDVSQYAHTSWKVRDGFVKGLVASMAQTPDGYLWLGTQFGLFRFDGVRAVPWQPPGDQHVPTGTVLSLLVTRDGTLWIGAKGLASWKDGKLIQYSELREQFVFALHEDAEGTLWVGSAAPPYGRFCAIRGGNVHCHGDDGSLGLGVFAVYGDSKGILWAGAKDGLWRWKPGPPKFYSLPGVTNGIQAIGEDTNGSLLVGWKNRLYRFIDGKIKAYSLPGVSLQFEARRILRDRNGGLWIATWNHGLVHVHQERTDVFSAVDGLSGDDDPALFEDHEGNIWVSTVDGLDRFRDYAVATFTGKQGLLRNLPASVLADQNGSVWLATYGGLNRWDRGQITSPLIGGDERLNDLHPQSLFQDNQGRVWISTSHELGYLEHDRFALVRKIADAQVLSIAQDTANTTWVINEPVGLLRISPENNFVQIPWSALEHKDHASVLAADRGRGGLWIGFFLGGISYFSGGQIRTSYTAADGLGTGRVSDFQFGDDGSLWISTEGGLSRLKNNRLATMTSKNGLPCDTVHWAVEDDENSMWLYTACGLVRIARSELDNWAAAVDKGQDKTPAIRVTVFDSSDGVGSLSEPDHYHPQVAKTPDGKIWFIPVDGVSVIDPHHLPFNKIPPPVHIEKITADDKTYDLSNDTHLPAQIRNLDIDYTALSLAVPEKVRFRVKLEGQDKDWRELTDRHVQYTNLPPKHYKFRVLACNNSGVWNEEGAALDFVIPPAWYQTNWFRAACVAAFLALVWGIHELRVRQLAAQFNMRLEERIRERTRIARDLHDTLLQSFQGLVFRFQGALNQLPNRPEKAYEVLESALVSADQAIAEGRSAIHQLRSESSEESNLEQMLLATGRELASSQNRGGSAPPLRVIVEGNRRPERAMIRDEIHRIARELLRNAYRHAHARNIEAELRYDDDAFLLVVRDDGKGIDPKVLKDRGRAGHWGFSGMYERAKGIGARLDIWSEGGAGTEVRLRVPAGIAYEKSGDRGRFKLFRKTRIYEHRP